MTVLSAQSLMERSLRYDQPIRGMIFEKRLVRGKSFGLSACGYDIRCAQTVRMYSGYFTLVSSVEEFNMPHDLVGIVHDKSTWAREGLAVQNTVIEPGWRGFLTLELTSALPLVIQRDDPIAQIIFHKLDEPSILPYDGKYQDQPNTPVKAIKEK